VKKSLFLALGGVVAFGVIAVLAVLLATREAAGLPDVAAGTRASVAPAGPAAPRQPRSAAWQEQVPVAGPPRLQLPDRIVAQDVTAPIAACLRANPTSQGGGGHLMLELEAVEGGGLLIVGAPVESWGNASKALVECARHVLEGRTISVGSYTPGERFRASYPLESAAPEAAPPPPSTLPSRRQQRGAGGGGSRR